MVNSTTGVRVSGVREVVRALERAGVELSDIKGVFSEISENAADRARRNVPVRSATLQGTIRASKSKNKAVVRAGSAGVRYAGPINYGWPAHGIEPSEFLTGAANDAVTQADSVEILERGISDLLARVNLA